MPTSFFNGLLDFFRASDRVKRDMCTIFGGLHFIAFLFVVVLSTFVDVVLGSIRSFWHSGCLSWTMIQVISSFTRDLEESIIQLVVLSRVSRLGDQRNEVFYIQKSIQPCHNIDGVLYPDLQDSLQAGKDNAST